jgi:polyisoprenoid-binding protein YceI
MTDITAIQIPGFGAGTWDIDRAHSEVSFVVRHLVVSKVRGRFDRFSGTIITDADLDRSSVTVAIDASSINTNEPNRDNHVRSTDFLDVENFPNITFRSTDFLDVENFPNITFRSTAVRNEGGRFFVDG